MSHFINFWLISQQSRKYFVQFCHIPGFLTIKIATLYIPAMSVKSLQLLSRLLHFECIEVWYNRKRSHSSLGYLSLEEFEQKGVYSMAA